MILNPDGSSSEFPVAEIAVTTFIDPVQYDFTRTLPQLQQVAATSDSRKIQDGSHPVGLAAGDLVIKFSSGYRLIGPPDGPFRAAISKINVDIGIQNNIIYVAHELPRNSCPHTEVLRHEETHKEIDRLILDEFQPAATDFFTGIATQAGIIEAPNTDEAQTILARHINEGATDFETRLHDTRVRRQQAFDSPEEYRRLSLTCDGLLQEIVTAHLRPY